MRAGFGAVLAREWRFLRANPWDLFLALWAPLGLMLLIGWLFSAALPREMPVVFADADGSALSRRFAQLVDATPGAHVVARVTSLTAAEALVQQGRAWAIAYAPVDAERDLKRDRKATLFVYFDAAYSVPSGVALSNIAGAAQALGAEVAVRDLALHAGLGGLRQPVRVQSTLLFNPQGSYDLFLTPLVQFAILALMASLCAASAVGRELRDGTALDWLAAGGGDMAVALAAKLAPYLAAFLCYGMAMTCWYALASQGTIAGSIALLFAGQVLLFAACCVISALFVGISASMNQGLTFVSLYVGPSIAFSGAIFPTDSGPYFTQVYSRLLPFTHYAELQSQQLLIGPPWTASVTPLLALAVFVAVATILAVPLVGSAARQPLLWGKR